MKADRRSVKIWRATVNAGIGAVMAGVLFYGAYRGIYEYIYYRDYKMVRSIKLRSLFDQGDDPSITELPVKFVSAMHDFKVNRRLSVRAENGKSFFILEFEDGHIQLAPIPVKRYWGVGWLTAYYDILDAAAKEKLRKMLDIHCHAKE